MRFWEEVRATDKNSFILYTDYFEQIELLNIEQRGILLTAIMSFQLEQDLPEMDAITKMCFSFISADMRRNNEKYAEIVEKRRVSGRKGGLQKQANLANATFATNGGSTSVANLANLAVNDNDNENVNDSENVSVSDNVSDPDGEQTTTHTDPLSEQPTDRPSNLDILGEIVQHGYRLEGKSIKAFMDYNDERGWKMDWRLALKRWADREVQHPPDQKQSPAGKFANFPQRNDPAHKALVNELIRRETGG